MKFPAGFDTVFTAENMEIILTPYRTPSANVYAERWVRSMREECLDHLLILNEPHLEHVLREYCQYYNCARPHQGLRQQIPESGHQYSEQGAMQRRDILEGLLHDYYRDVA